MKPGHERDALKPTSGGMARRRQALGMLASCLILASCLSDEKSGDASPGPSIDTLPLPPYFIRAIPGERSMEVLWAPSEQPAGAEAFVYEARTFPDTSHSCQANSNYSCVIQGLVNGTTYGFRVRALRNAPPGNWGPWSYLDSVQLPPAVPPGTPGSPVSDYSDSEEGAFRVSWQPSAFDGGAPVTYRAFAVGDSSKQCTSVQTSCTVANLEPGTTYSFRVEASNVAGSSAPSEATDPLKLQVVTPLNFTARASGTAAHLQAVAWTGTRAIAVGEGGVILTSPDGVSWTARASGTARNLTGVAWNGAQVMAVGDSGTVLSSPDGTLWSPAQAPTESSLRAIAGSDSRFVVVGGSRIFTFTNGSWNLVSSDGDSLSHVRASSTGILVAVGKERGFRSTDGGSTWQISQPRASAFNFPEQVGGLSSDSLFALARNETFYECRPRSPSGHGGCDYVPTSASTFWISRDGVNWTQRVTPGRMTVLTSFHSQWIGVLENGQVARTYTLGKTWIREDPGPQGPQGPYGSIRAFADCGSFLVGVGADGAVYTAPRSP